MEADLEHGGFAVFQCPLKVRAQLCAVAWYEEQSSDFTTGRWASLQPAMRPHTRSLHGCRAQQGSWYLQHCCGPTKTHSWFLPRMLSSPTSLGI